jgi:hypothetical protein
MCTSRCSRQILTASHLSVSGYSPQFHHQPIERSKGGDCSAAQCVCWTPTRLPPAEQRHGKLGTTGPAIALAAATRHFVFNASGRARMNTAKFSIEFGEHISRGAMGRMVSILAVYGGVSQGTSDRKFRIEVFRTAKLAKLKRQLTHFERCGDIRWSEHSETSD